MELAPLSSAWLFAAADSIACILSEASTTCALSSSSSTSLHSMSFLHWFTSLSACLILVCRWLVRLPNSRWASAFLISRCSTSRVPSSNSFCSSSLSISDTFSLCSRSWRSNSVSSMCLSSRHWNSRRVLRWTPS